MGGLIEVGGIEVNAIDGAAVRLVRPGRSHSSPPTTPNKEVAEA